MTDDCFDENAPDLANPSQVCELRAELQLLIRCSRVRMDTDDVEDCHRLIDSASPTFDWSYLLGQAWQQKVLPLLGRNLDVYGIADSGTWPFHMVYLANCTRSSLLLNELDRVLAHLETVGIPVIVRKGAVLLSLVYGDPGLRRMGDIDLLVLEQDAERLRDALIDFGYSHQRIAGNHRTLEPFDRSKELLWRLNLDSLLPLNRIAGEPHIGHYQIDVVKNLFQRQSGISIPAEELFERRRPFRISVGSAWRLSPEDFLVDLCAHLHKEATTLFYINSGDDIQLMKFCDIAQFIERSSDQVNLETFVQIVLQHHLQVPIFFSLYWTRVLYPDAVPQGLLEAVKPEEDGSFFLDAYGQMEGKKNQWKMSFLERLFRWDRRLHVAERSLVQSL